MPSLDNSTFRTLLSKFCQMTGTCATLLLTSLLVAAPAPTASTQLNHLAGETMGTTFTVKFIAPDNVVQPLRESIRQRLAEINKRMSTYDRESELSQFNAAGADQWFSVSVETATVVQRALDFSKQTDGAFDVTVGPIVRLWKFGAYDDEAAIVPQRKSIPTEAQIRATLELVGADKLQVTIDPPALRKSVDGLEVDLSAIAKGYAVDEVANLLDQLDLSSWMVEIGGEIRVQGAKGDGSPWNIGIEAPTTQQRTLQLVVTPVDTAVASSGDYRNYFEFEGALYSHTMDPRTGRPVAHDLAAVTVAAPDCLSADALATAILVMGRDEGLAWTELNNVAALFLSRDRDGKILQEANALFTANIASLPTPNLPSHSMNWSGVAMMSLLIFTVAMAGMAIGVIVSNRRIKGSCGGLAGMKDEHGRSICDACSNPSPECRGEPESAR